MGRYCKCDKPILEEKNSDTPLPWEWKEIRYMCGIRCIVCGEFLKDKGQKTNE